MGLGSLGHVHYFCGRVTGERCGKLGGSSRSWVNGVGR